MLVKTCWTKGPMACRTTCPSCTVTTAIRTSPLTLHLWETQGSGRKHRENMKDYPRKWMEEQAQSLTDKTTGPPRPGMMPALHMGGPPMMPMTGPPPPGWCQWGLLLEWDHLGSAHASDAWAPRMRPAAHPMMWPLSQEWLNWTDKEGGEPLSVSFLWLGLLHQEIMVLWFCVFPNSMTKQTHPLFLSKKELVLEGSSGRKNFHLYCEMWKKIVNSVS